MRTTVGSVIPLVVLGLWAGCSSSSGSFQQVDGAGQGSDARDTMGGLGPDGSVLRLDVAGRADGWPAGLDSPSDAPASSIDSSTSDRPITGPDGGRMDDPARDASRVDTRSGSDSSKDVQGVCTPGIDLTCSHYPTSSAVAGICQADGTCVCRPGHTIVSSSGRCMAVTHENSDASAPDAELACAAPYTSCVCQCCPDAPRNTACYYPTAGETLQAIKDKEATDRSVTNCGGAGCSAGTRYICCMPAAPEPSSAATYSSSAYSGDMDHVTISKVGTTCAQLLLSRPAETRTGFHLDGASGWGLMTATLGACADASNLPKVAGALGSVEFHGDDDNCMVDVHVTLYAFSATGEIKTTRMDIDGLAVKGLFGCR